MQTEDEVEHLHVHDFREFSEPSKCLLAYIINLLVVKDKRYCMDTYQLQLVEHRSLSTEDRK